MASQYSITPEQFFSYTPRQVQMCLKHMHIRLHNDLATRMNIADKKMDYIDTRKDKIHDNIRENEGGDLTKLEEATNNYLANLKANHG